MQPNVTAAEAAVYDNKRSIANDVDGRLRGHDEEWANVDRDYKLLADPFEEP